MPDPDRDGLPPGAGENDTTRRTVRNDRRRTGANATKTGKEPEGIRRKDCF